MADKIESQVMFYRKPEALTVDQHAALRIRTASKPYAFASGQPLIPLLVGEFSEACTDYPIIFAGQERTPMVVTGLQGGTSQFIDEAGQYESNAYIPAFIRRYPFVAANDPNNPGAIVACIDMGSDNVSSTEGAPIYENGQPSAFGLQCLSFLEQFEAGRRATEAIVKLWNELDLFEQKVFEIDVGSDERRPIASYLSLSGEKLDGLGGEALARLNEVGGLGPAYAQTFSLANWMKVLQRAFDSGSLSAKSLMGEA